MERHSDFTRLRRMLEVTMTARVAFDFIPTVFRQVLDHFVRCHVFKLRYTVTNAKIFSPKSEVKKGIVWRRALWYKGCVE
jgi:hypothetical protein